MNCILILLPSLQISSAFPSFICLKPNFTSITRLSTNNSYFMVDTVGRFWNKITSDSKFVGPGDLRSKKAGDIKNLVSQVVTTSNYSERATKLGEQGFNTFDLTFRTSFDKDCSLTPEKLIGMKV